MIRSDARRDGWTGGRRVGWFMAAAAACSLTAAMPLPAGAAPPHESDKNAAPAQKPVRSMGPRRMQLGGTRAAAPKKIEKLGGVKLPIKSLSDRKLRPRYSLHPQGSALEREPRLESAGGSNTPIAPTRTTPVAGVPETASTLRGELVRAALLSGSGARNAAFERSFRQHGFGDDVEVGPRIRLNPADDAFRSQGAAAFFEGFSRRGSIAPGVAATLGLYAAPGQGTVALELARRELTKQGYTEIQLGRGDYGFVRVPTEVRLREIQKQIVLIRTRADRNEMEYEWAVRCAENRRPRPDCDDLDPWRVGREYGAEGLDPNLAHGAPPVETPPQPGFEAALVAMDEGRFGDAATELKTYLAGEPEDMEVVRLLGVAQLLDGQIAAGVESIGAAYQTDPHLAARPFPTELITQRPGELRRALSATVGHAHRTRSADAWLAAALLMDVEGRPEQALKMLERAIEQGLDQRTADEMTLALRE